MVLTPNGESLNIHNIRNSQKISKEILQAVNTEISRKQPKSTNYQETSMETLQSMRTSETSNDGLKYTERTQETHVRTEYIEIIEDPIRPGSYKTF